MSLWWHLCGIWDPVADAVMAQLITRKSVLGDGMRPAVPPSTHNQGPYDMSLPPLNGVLAPGLTQQRGRLD